MTEKYTPEKVAELVAKARFIVERHGMTQSTILIDRLAEALAAVSAERDLYEQCWLAAREVMRMAEDERDEAQKQKDAWKRVADANALTAGKHEADRDRLHKAIAEALDSLDENEDPDVVTIGILRAALDKEGSDDE